MTTLAELLDFPGSDGVKTVLLSFLQRIEFPVTDWQSGGVVRTHVELESAVVSDLLEAIVVQVAGGFLDLSEGDWLTTLAHGWYEIDRLPPSAATQTVTLANSSAFSYPITTATVLGATDGSRYFAASGGTLPAGGTLGITAVAESPGTARGLVSTLIPPLPGVTVAGAAITIVGIPQYGADEEKDASVVLRCAARWPSFDIDDDTSDRVTKWALAGSVEVTRTRLDPDTVNPGGVLLTVAGAAGNVTAPALAAVVVYVNKRVGITDYITVQNASNTTITASGTVVVPAALAAQIKTDANLAWMAYLAVEKIGGTVYLAELIQAVMDAGAIDFTGAMLNGVPASLVLGALFVAIPNGTSLATLLTWVET
jgi:hypothetical protein